MNTGYYVSASSAAWEQTFTDAAMRLEMVGDVSEPVMGSRGVHILYYNSDVTPGEVGLEAIRDSLYESTLSTKQTEAYDAAYAEWLKAANVKTYPDRLVLE